MAIVVDLCTRNCECASQKDVCGERLTFGRTDIEQETNGLYTFDRKEKLPAAEVKKIIEDAKSVYYDRLKQKLAGKV